MRLSFSLLFWFFHSLYSNKGAGLNDSCICLPSYANNVMDDRTTEMDATGIPIPVAQLYQRLLGHQIQLDRLIGVVTKLVQFVRAHPVVPAPPPSAPPTTQPTACPLVHHASLPEQYGGDPNSQKCHRFRKSPPSFSDSRDGPKTRWLWSGAVKVWKLHVCYDTFADSGWSDAALVTLF